MSSRLQAYLEVKAFLEKEKECLPDSEKLDVLNYILNQCIEPEIELLRQNNKERQANSNDGRKKF